MTELRALSLHQPWASLCVPLTPGEKPVKTIETRNKPLKYRGRLLLHAAKRAPVGGAIGDFYVEPWYDDVRHLEDACYCEPDGITPECARRARSRLPVLTKDGRVVARLPLGAIVAVARLVDVVPITKRNSGEPDPGAGPYLIPYNDGVLGLVRPPCEQADFSLTKERPWGDFSVGRYAWLLADVRKLPEPIPAKGKQGLWRPDDDLRAKLDQAAAS